MEGWVSSLLEGAFQDSAIERSCADKTWYSEQMKAQFLFFTAPGQVEVRDKDLPSLEDHQVLVKTICSGISPGTEMLVYRGYFPKDHAEQIDIYSSDLKYPFKFGYASVGKIQARGEGVTEAWQDKLVFSFQPHCSHFVTSVDTLHPLPEGYSPELGCFLPNMETSVNLVQDAAPILGERALVLGQGIVGLLTTALLSEFPLQTLVTVDRYPKRRGISLSLGANASFGPDDQDFRKQAGLLLLDGADLTLELSGSPDALNDAIALTGFGGRIVVGSWYGERRATLDLGGKFHRYRQRIISSQVSTISASLSDRWDKARRFETAWDALKRIHPERWITHRFRFEQAAEAYKLLDESPWESIQIIFDYPD